MCAVYCRRWLKVAVAFAFFCQPCVCVPNSNQQTESLKSHSVSGPTPPSLPVRGYVVSSLVVSSGPLLPRAGWLAGWLADWLAGGVLREFHSKNLIRF